MDQDSAGTARTQTSAGVKSGADRRWRDCDSRARSQRGSRQREKSPMGTDGGKRTSDRT
jgi:hypothetical protein